MKSMCLLIVSLYIFLVIFIPSQSFRLSPMLTTSVKCISSKITPIKKFGISLQAVKDEKKNDNPNGYWEGDWVCADCGYIYDRDIDGNGLYFEEQKKGFVCPQCQAPRKRYAKKVGDQWGVTRDGGDFPIYITTFVGLALTTWFALVYVPTL